MTYYYSVTCLKPSGLPVLPTTDLIQFTFTPLQDWLGKHGTQGETTQAIHQYAEVNSHYMGDQFDPMQESSYLQYLDYNNLYG